MSSIRVWHTYIGILIAPSVIFFALTGALQIFNLHEAHGKYVPPAVIEKLSSLHKDQVFTVKAKDEDKADPPNDSDQQHSAPPAPEEESTALRTLLLKWFFLLVALALTTSTLMGLWIGLTHIQRKRTGYWMLAVGTIVPIALVIM